MSKRRLMAALFLILLANALLFIREQVQNDYMLDVELPGGSFVFQNGALTSTPETVEPKAAYERYLIWLESVKDLPLRDAAEMLEAEKKSLSEKLGEGTAEDSEKLDYIAVNALLDRADYLTGYGDWLENIQKNKENLLDFALFNDPNSFSGRNIVKTAEEFKKLENVELSLGADGAVESFLSFRLTDYFLLAILLLLALSFQDERKAGLWNVVRASPNGRLRLASRRMCIILAASVFGVAALYGVNLLIGFALYGGVGDLGRPVQSVMMLGKLPMMTTVGGFLVRFFILRAAAAFLVGLLMWLMLTSIDNVKYTVIVASAVLAVEYGFYTFLPVQSVFNALKYFNIFTYISLTDLYTNYLNIDFLGVPIGIRNVSQLALIPLCLLFAAICIYSHCHKKPSSGRDLLGRAAYFINGAADKLLRRLHLFGMELHKTLYIEKGVVVAAALIYAALNLSYKVTIPVASLEEIAAKKYTAEFAGEITDETIKLMDAEQAELNIILADYEAAKRDYENGLIKYSELDKYAREASSAEIGSKGLATVRSRVEQLKSEGKREGFVPWLIDEEPFESVYGSRANDNQNQAALVSILALTLLLAGSMAYERQSGMTFLLRSTARGRGAIVMRKILLAVSMTTLVASVVYGMEIYTLLKEFAVTAWDAPARNLSMLSSFPFNCSIKAWLMLLYFCRWVCLLCCAVVVLLISSLAKRCEASCIAGCAVMLIPSLLYAYINIEALRPLSVILPVEVMPLLAASNGAIFDYLPWVASLVGVAAASAVWLFVSANGIRRKG